LSYSTSIPPSSRSSTPTPHKRRSPATLTTSKPRDIKYTREPTSSNPRTSPTHYADPAQAALAYAHGYQDACNEPDNEEARRFTAAYTSRHNLDQAHHQSTFTPTAAFKL
jgi:hypothetical protein